MSVYAWERIWYPSDLAAFHNEALPIRALAGWDAPDLETCLIHANSLPIHLKGACLLTHNVTAQSSQLALPSKRETVRKQNFTSKNPEVKYAPFYLSE